MTNEKKVAVITGAAQGIGLAVAKALLQDGRKVVFIDINEEALNELKQDSLLRENKEDVIFITMDVTKVDEIKEGVQQIVDKWKRLDILVNNAGIRKETSVKNMELDEWNKVMDTNLTSTFFFSQAVLQIMEGQKWGRIINVSSIGGQEGSLISGAHYCASKAGQFVLTKIFAKEGAGKGITVNTIAPAAIRTPEMDGMDPNTLTELAKTIPVGRFGEEDEVAKLVCYLASKDTGYITGATFDINGGRLMR